MLFGGHWPERGNAVCARTASFERLYRRCN
jgi:hypothetical protein